MSEVLKNPGWKVTFAGTGINLALGVLYTWSIFQAVIVESIKSGDGVFDWSLSSVGDPYAVACLVFAFTMIAAGKVQDKFGPRVTAFIGGLLVGLGLIIISYSTNYFVWVLGFGIFAGGGIGFGYASATPPALKWFPGGQTGLIAGLVVSGFGLAPVYIAPLASYFVGTYGMATAMLIFGVAFFILVSLLSLFLVNPPDDYTPPIRPDARAATIAPEEVSQELDTHELLRSSDFWKLWFIYFIGAGAGLMVISSVAGMAKASMGEAAFVVVAIMAVGNASGRIIAGVVSDVVGRKITLAGFLALQALNMFLAIYVISSEGAMALFIILTATFIGFNYGTNLALFPAFCKTWWGAKNFGVNYGLLFTSWGIGGFVMTRVSSMLVANTGTYVWSFVVAGSLLLIGVFMTMSLRTSLPPVHSEA